MLSPRTRRSLDRPRRAADGTQDPNRLLIERRGSAQAEDHEAEAQTGDIADTAQSLTAQGVDDAVAAALRDRLAALNRALRRVDDGTYGRSIRSGVPISDERLEADPPPS